MVASVGTRGGSNRDRLVDGEVLVLGQEDKCEDKGSLHHETYFYLASRNEFEVDKKKIEK